MIIIKSRFTTYFYLAAALFFITAAFFLLPPSNFANIGEEKSAAVEVSSLAAEENVYETFIYLYPSAPAPGDFFVVEAGPLDAGSIPELSFDFPGTVSGHYHSGDIFYAIIAIGLDTEPGRYNLELDLDSYGDAVNNLSVSIEIAAKDFHFSSFSMPPDRTVGWTAERLAEDREKVRLARLTTEAQPLWLQPFLLPLEGRISSEYGAVRVINNNPPRRHNGIDIVADEGTAVIATNKGIVRLSEFLLSGGNTVIIDHGMDISSTYMHLHTLEVETGQTVKRGELIGTVGMTGYATGPHLHWEVNIGQRPVNPLQLLKNELLWIIPPYGANQAGGTSVQ